MPETRGPETREDQAGDGISFWITVTRLPKAGMPIDFDARPQECEALARRLDIPAVESLVADVLVAPWRADGVKITGRVKAAVVQHSVVTMEPLHRSVDEPIDLVFVPETSRLARDETLSELNLDPEGDDIPETFTGDRIDLGELLAEIVSLGLDPYPREEDAAFEAFDTDPEPHVGKVSPFAGLAKLKPKGD